MTSNSEGKTIRRRATLDRVVIIFLLAFALYQLVLGGTMVYLLAHSNDATDAIKDCTVSSGKCYKSGERRTGGAVKVINDATIAAIACGQRYNTEADIRACVVQSLGRSQTN